MGFLRHARKCNGCKHFNASTTSCDLSCTIAPDTVKQRSQVFFPLDIKECAENRRLFADSALNIKIIAALGRDRSIGKNQKLIFHIPSDLKHFKATTLNGVLVLGRKTFESLPGVLPGREHWVLSSNQNLSSHPNVRVFKSLDELFIHARSSLDGRVMWIAGGGDIYRKFLPYANELVLTMVESEDSEADTFFPAIPHHFMELNSTERLQEPKDQSAYVIRRYATVGAGISW